MSNIPPLAVGKLQTTSLTYWEFLNGKEGKSFFSKECRSLFAFPNCDKAEI